MQWTELEPDAHYTATVDGAAVVARKVDVERGQAWEIAGHGVTVRLRWPWHPWWLTARPALVRRWLVERARALGCEKICRT